MFRAWTEDGVAHKEIFFSAYGLQHIDFAGHFYVYVLGS